MSEDLTVRRFEEGDQLTLHLTGELDVVSAGGLADHATAVAGVRHLHVDLSALEFVDIKGAQALEQVLIAARDHGAGVSITGASEAHLRLLALMGLAEFSSPA